VVLRAIHRNSDNCWPPVSIEIPGSDILGIQMLRPRENIHAHADRIQVKEVLMKTKAPTRTKVLEIEQLKSRFNNAVQSVRVLSLLSPS